MIFPGWNQGIDFHSVLDTVDWVIDRKHPAHEKIVPLFLKLTFYSSVPSVL